MRGKHVFLFIAIICGIAALIFHKELQKMLDGESSAVSGFSLTKTKLKVDVKFSVIRYDNKPVSAVAIGNPNDKINHFFRVDENALKSILGVEGYYKNKRTIEEYRGERIEAAYVPSRGGFVHKIESMSVIIE